ASTQHMALRCSDPHRRWAKMVELAQKREHFLVVPASSWRLSALTDKTFAGKCTNLNSVVHFPACYFALPDLGVELFDGLFVVCPVHLFSSHDKLVMNC